MSAFEAAASSRSDDPVITIEESELDNGFTAAEVFSNAECLGRLEIHLTITCTSS